MNMPILYGALLFMSYLLAMFVIVDTKKDTSIGNFTWGGGCLLLTLYTFFMFGSYHPRQILITLLIALWCIRLAYYVWLRYKKGADRRYIVWLEQWNYPLVAFLFSAAWVIGLNGFFALIMATPSALVNITPNQTALNLIDFIGIAMWVIGFFFEAVSDYQMYTFKQDPAHKNKILQTGLWKYSRHPNYFGEIAMWWGIYLLALSVPYGWLTIIAPGAISITLLFVTGVPWAEQAMATLPGYEEYKRKTSMIFPWFAKK